MLRFDRKKKQEEINIYMPSLRNLLKPGVEKQWN
jgi:hypothetical protein